MSGLGWLTARPIAHRGLHDARRGIVENTGPAVTAAAEAGYGIEVDLRIAADGAVMVFHDATLDRLTCENGPLVARTGAALRKIAIKGADARILTLEDLLGLVCGRVPLLLEVKSHWGRDEGLEQRITDILAGYRGPVAVMSFDPDTLIRFAGHAPDLPRGIVAERFRQANYWSQLTPWQRFAMRHLLHGARTSPDFVAYDIKGLPSAAPLVARHAFGLPLLTWTVRTVAEQRRARLFADAMIFEGFRP